MIVVASMIVLIVAMLAVEWLLAPHKEQDQ